MRNLQIIIEYDGSNYHGWQMQKEVISVQQKVEEAIHVITGENNSINGASRTDSGVHARGQSANFYTENRIPIDRIPYALNCNLPDDIRVQEAVERSKDFHSRYQALGKRYSYQILNNTFGSALESNRAWHVPQQLDIDSMNKANEYFIGTHDFTSFRAVGSSVKSSERSIYSSKIIHNNERVILEIEGNGFLYNMVRIIMGTLVAVGIGKIPYKKIPEIIDSRNRNLAGITAPAKGLYLEKVYYEKQ